MGGLVTVIVPAYNAGDTIERCVDSITGQTYRDLQIIIVDDGSKDDTGGICGSLAENDPRIEMIHQENGGVSAARNAGLQRARGEWIAWADADDYVSPYYIEDMLAAVREDCGIVLCRPVYMDNNDPAPAPFKRTRDTRYITGREACIRNFGYETNRFNSGWGKLVRARLWVGLRYPVGKINEDIHVSHALLYRAGTVAITDAVLYAYIQTRGSITRGAFSLRRLDILDAWEEATRFFNEGNETGLADVARRVYCTRVMDARFVCKKKAPCESEAHKNLRLRSVQAYDEVKKITRYMDCSARRALAYRMKFFTGRWCYPLYALCFVRFSRRHTYI